MTRELPFKCLVSDVGETVQIPFSGESIALPADAVAVYDVIMGYNMTAEMTTDLKQRDKYYAVVRKGLDWFRKHEPEGYMVLLD